MSKVADPKQAVSESQNEETAIEISPEADAAMRGLIELFSDPKIRSTASFRCCTDGPTEFDALFESIMEEAFGDDSEYKQWVKRLHDLGLIPRLPDEWK